MACDDVGVFVHEGKLLLLPKSRGNSSHVCVLYPETGRYQLYTLDNLSKVSVAPLCLWSEREREESLLGNGATAPVCLCAAHWYKRSGKSMPAL